MSAASLSAFIARCRILCRPHEHITDAELLRRFTQQRDADAFGQLLQRYAPLVWGVCRRILPQESDSEDAFQAVFLALVRRPDAIDVNQSLGAWLHTVAVRVAQRTLAGARRQQPLPIIPEQATLSDVADEVGSRELFRIVDEEIERLPVAVRAPLILCCLEGRTRDEAAVVLGCSVSAVKSRLERGRNLLRRRLERRGVQLPVAFLVLGLTGGRVHAALWTKTMQSALYTPAQEIIALAEAGVSATAIGKGKLLLAALLLLSGAAGAVGSLLLEKPVQAPAATQTKIVAADLKKEVPQVRKDRHGDPLPEGALARLGTVRWRHGFLVLDLAYSPDGKMIAAVGAGRAITLWDAATGKELRQFPDDGQPICLAFSPNGKLLATAYPADLLWDVAAGKIVHHLNGHQAAVCGIAFAPDGKTLTTASRDGSARIWEASTGKELHKLECEQGGLYAAAYSPDGKLLATAGGDGTIRMWNMATAKERRRLAGHKKEVFKILFSPDGKQLASSSADETIRLWDAATGRQARVLGEKLGAHWLTIAYSPDGKLLASGHLDGTIRLWDLIACTEKRCWQAGIMSVRAISFSPDGKTVAAATAWDGGIRLWDTATGKERDSSRAHHGAVGLLRFSPDGATLLSIGRDCSLLRWDLAANVPTQLFSWTPNSYRRSALSADGNTLAINGWPNSLLRLWDVRSGKPGRAFGKPRQGYYWVFAISPDGRLVAAEGDDRLIHVWDVRDGKEIRQFTGFTSQTSRLCFSPDGKALACAREASNKGAGERPLRLWDLSTGKERCSFDSHASGMEAIAFSPDGKMLASAGYSRGSHGEALVHIWDAATGKELSRHKAHGESFLSVAFSPDGKLVATGASGSGAYPDDSIRIWEAATGRLIRRFVGHHSGVGSVAFSSDGLTVASGAGDSTILLWDITGRRTDGRWHAKTLTLRQLDACWPALANDDAAKAYDAVWALVAAPEQAVPFLQKHLPLIPRPDAKTVARLIANLDSEDFLMRQKATEELSKLRDAIAPTLRQALAAKPSLEMRRRVQQLLDQTRDWTAERLRDHRAIQALEHIGTQPAREVLHLLAEGAPAACRTEEAKAALRRLSRDR